VLWKLDAHYSAILSVRFHAGLPFKLTSVGRDATVKQWVCDKVFSAIVADSILNGPADRPMQFFRPIPGAANLSRLAHYIADPSVPQQFQMEDIYHLSTCVQIAREKVAGMLHRHNSANLVKRAMERKKLLRDAAEIALHRGDARQYCELLFDAGEVDRAVAASPAVSMEFWREMLERKSAIQSDLAPKLLTGHFTEAVSDLLDTDMQAAMVVAAAARAGRFAVKSQFSVMPPKRGKAEVRPRDLNGQRFLQEYAIAAQLAERHLQAGDPLLMACAYLSVGDVESALVRLARCGELFFALEIDILTQANLRQVRVQFAKVCIAHGIAVESVFELLELEDRRRLAPMVRLDDRSQFFETIGILPLPEPVSVRDRIHAMLCNGEDAGAVALFLKTAREMLVRPAWDFGEIKELLEEMEFCRLVGCRKTVMKEVIAISLYVATFDVMWKGYEPILNHVHSLVESIIRKRRLTWMEPLLVQMKLAFTLTARKEDLARVTVQGANELNRVTDETTDKSRRGPILYIGDDGGRISLLNATMWFDVTPFSPLASGEVFYVF
jgi:hypothetical protein